MIDWWGLIIMEYYVGSEGNGLMIINSVDWLVYFGLVGCLVIGVFYICDEGGIELLIGE